MKPFPFMIKTGGAYTIKKGARIRTKDGALVRVTQITDVIFENGSLQILGYCKPEGA